MKVSYASKRVAGARLVRRLCIRTEAASSTAGQVDADSKRAIDVLKQAAANGAVPASQVVQALLSLEKNKLTEDNWGEKLGSGPGGRRWRLVFSTSAKDVKEGKKGGKAGGFYFPIPAAQRWEQDKGVIENGIYLGQVAALVFSGPYEYQKKKLSFDFTKLSIRLGPKWIPFNIGSFKKKDKADPFFLFIYVDDEIVAARGRGGGIGLWQRATAEWELKTGVSL